MRTFIITVTLPSGLQGEFFGLFTDGFAAAIEAIENFPNARRIGVRRLP